MACRSTNLCDDRRGLFYVAFLSFVLSLQFMLLFVYCVVTVPLYGCCNIYCFLSSFFCICCCCCCYIYNNEDVKGLIAGSCLLGFLLPMLYTF